MRRCRYIGRLEGAQGFALVVAGRVPWLVRAQFDTGPFHLTHRWVELPSRDFVPADRRMEPVHEFMFRGHWPRQTRRLNTVSCSFCDVVMRRDGRNRPCRRDAR